MQQGHAVDQLYFVCDGVLVRFYISRITSAFYLFSSSMYQKFLVRSHRDNIGIHLRIYEVPGTSTPTILEALFSSHYSISSEISRFFFIC